MDLSFAKSFAKAQQLNGVSLSTFLASISTSVLVFSLQISIFLAIRRRLPAIYPPIPRILEAERLEWQIPQFAELIRFPHDHGHFDRYFFRRYIRTILFIFLPAALLITPILVPVNYIDGKAANLGVSGLDTLGWSNVGINHSGRYWVHLFLGFLFIGHVCWIIWRELSLYVTIRQDSPAAARRTVLVDGIPHEWMTEEALAAQFDVFAGRIISISFNRDLSIISRLIAKRDSLLRALEASETAKLGRAITCQSGIMSSNEKRLVDESACCPEDLVQICKEIEAKQAKPEDFQPMPSAFITFDNPLAAHTACQTVIHPQAGFMTPRTLPIGEDDIVWSNVCMSWLERGIRSAVFNLLIVALAALCAVPISFAGLLSQVIYLTHAVTWLRWISNLPEWSLGLIQGVVPPIILAVLVKLFSAGLEYFVKKQGISSKAFISLRMQDFFFCFLFIQVTLVVSLSAGLTTIVNEVASGGALAATLAKNLPKASNYFLSYVLLQALSVSANSLLRIDRLFSTLVIGPLFDKTVTQMVLRQKGQDLQWGIFIPVYTNLACIGFLYSIISPIIIPFQVLIFTLFWFIYSSSSILFTTQDTGGSFYPKSLKHLLSGLYLMEASLVGLFILVRDAKGEPKCIGQACFMALSMPFTAVYHHLICKSFDPLLDFTATSRGRDTESHVQSNCLFKHKALRSKAILRLPHDSQGLSSSKALRISEQSGISVSTSEATISESGKIELVKLVN